jgi:hypothetical protein
MDAAEKRGTAGSTSWWKRGAAITPSSMRKRVRISRRKGGCSFGHNLTGIREVNEERSMTWKYSRR